MQWVKRLFKVPEHVIKIQVDGESNSDTTIDSLMAMAGIFKTIPHLQSSLMADFRDTMDVLEKLPGNAHEDRIRVAQKACDLWRTLSIPHYSLMAANAMLASMNEEQNPKENHKQGPTGPSNVM